MMEKNSNLEDVVSLITQKVAERLGGQGSAAASPSKTNKSEVPCQASAKDYDQKLGLND